MLDQSNSAHTPATSRSRWLARASPAGVSRSCIPAAARRTSASPPPARSPRPSPPTGSTLRLRGGVLELTNDMTNRFLGSAAGNVNWIDATDAGSSGFAASGTLIVTDYGALGSTGTGATTVSAGTLSVTGSA